MDYRAERLRWLSVRKEFLISVPSSASSDRFSQGAQSRAPCRHARAASRENCGQPPSWRHSGCPASIVGGFKPHEALKTALLVPGIPTFNQAVRSPCFSSRLLKDKGSSPPRSGLPISSREAECLPPHDRDSYSRATRHDYGCVPSFVEYLVSRSSAVSPSCLSSAVSVARSVFEIPRIACSIASACPANTFLMSVSPSGVR